MSACAANRAAPRGGGADAPVRIVMEEHRIPAGDAGIELYLRNKHSDETSRFSPDRVLLFVHGATYPAEATFDLAQAVFQKLTGAAWKRFVEIGEGTHTVMMEKNRLQLFQEVQLFLEEPPAKAPPS